MSAPNPFQRSNKITRSPQPAPVSKQPLASPPVMDRGGVLVSESVNTVVDTTPIAATTKAKLDQFRNVKESIPTAISSPKRRLSISPESLNPQEKRWNMENCSDNDSVDGQTDINSSPNTSNKQTPSSETIESKTPLSADNTNLTTQSKIVDLEQRIIKLEFQLKTQSDTFVSQNASLQNIIDTQNAQIEKLNLDADRLQKTVDSQKATIELQNRAIQAERATNAENTKRLLESEEKLATFEVDMKEHEMDLDLNVERPEVAIISTSLARDTADIIQKEMKFDDDFKVQEHIFPGTCLDFLQDGATEILDSKYQPKNIVIQGGGIDSDQSTAPAIMAKYKRLIKTVRLAAPSSRICISAIPLRSHHKNKNLPKYKTSDNRINILNLSLKSFAEKQKNIEFIDICPKESKLFERDGIHMNINGKREYAENLVNNINYFHVLSDWAKE